MYIANMFLIFTATVNVLNYEVNYVNMFKTSILSREVLWLQ